MGTALKVTVVLDISTAVEITDFRYLGSSASIEDHINKAKRDISNWKFFLQKDPARTSEQIKPNIKLSRVVVEEDN